MEKRRKVYIPIMRVTCGKEHVTPYQNLEDFIKFLHDTNREGYTRLMVSVITRFGVSPRDAYSKVSQTSAKDMAKEIAEYFHSHLESEEVLYPLYVFDSLPACNEYLNLYNQHTDWIRYFEVYVSGHDCIHIGDIDERTSLYITNKAITDRVDHSMVTVEKVNNTGIWIYSRVDANNSIVDKHDLFVETDKE